MQKKYYLCSSLVKNRNLYKQLKYNKLCQQELDCNVMVKRTNLFIT